MMPQIPQNNAGGPLDEQASLPYRRYEGDPEYARQRQEILYEQPPGEKVYQLPRDNTNMYRLLVFVIAMVTLLAFVIVCLVLVGGTGGWISFCAASLAILVIASTFISMKREGEK